GLHGQRHHPQPELHQSPSPHHLHSPPLQEAGVGSEHQEVQHHPKPVQGVPQADAHNLQHNINHLLQHAKTHRSVPVQRLAAVVSQGMALTRAILPAKLLLHNAYHNIGQRTSWNSSIKLSPATTNNLKEWRHSLSTWNGRIAVLRPHDVILETNASLSGWGASSSCQTLTAAGWWSSDDSKSHINILKLATVRNTILALQPHLQGKAILMRCNNIATVAHLNHMGGQSVAMNRVQKEIHLLCKRLHIQLSSAYLPGLCNSEADRLSRLHPHHEWHLSREAFESINKKWGPHSIDQTATRENRQLPRFNSRFMEADGEATDCLLQDWRNDNNWTAPPIALIPHILNLVERQGVTATIVAPIWPGCRWASHLQRLLINSPDLWLPNPAGWSPAAANLLNQALVASTWC
ncbi:reverse transcriptase, partial [Acanthamoeba castellanii str. Neff]